MSGMPAWIKELKEDCVLRKPKRMPSGLADAQKDKFLRDRIEDLKVRHSHYVAQVTTAAGSVTFLMSMFLAITALTADHMALFGRSFLEVAPLLFWGIFAGAVCMTIAMVLTSMCSTAIRRNYAILQRLSEAPDISPNTSVIRTKKSK